MTIQKAVLAAIATIALLSTAALAYAPYLPRLIYEGYPSSTWPDSGYFADIAGDTHTPIIKKNAGAPKRTLPSELTELFNATGGKAFLIEHAGRVEFEHYAGGIEPGTKFNSFSMAKSLVGALMFKALAEKRLKSLDMSVDEFLPDYGDAAFRSVTLRDVLRMRGGVLFHRDDPLAADEPKDLEAALYNPFGPMARLHAGGLEAIENGLTADPSMAGLYRYQNVNSAVLSAILEVLYSRSIADLLSEKIWRPAGASTAYWRRYRKGGAVSAYCCIFATPHDWIKVGRYLMRNGTQSGRFLPDSLWREMMGRDLQPTALRTGVYGYHIRHDVLDRPGEALHGQFTYMMGQGGQILYLLPDQDLLVLRFGDHMQLLHTTLYAAWRALNGSQTNAQP